MKNYSGNYKPYIAVLVKSEILEKVKPVLEELSSSLNLCVVTENDKAGSKVKRACGVIAFLSEGFSKSDALQEELIEADNLGTQIIPVYADSSEQSELVKRALFSKNAVFMDKYPETSALTERLMSAEILREPFVTDLQKKTARTVRTVLIAMAAVVAVLGGIFIYSRLGGYRATKYDKSILDSFGYTEEELEKISGVMIIGDEIFTEKSNYKDYTNTEYYSYSTYAHNTSEDDYSCWYYNDTEAYGSDKIVQKSYESLNFLRLLPNVEYIALIKVDADALPDLSENEALTSLFISDCNFEDISGLKNSSVTVFESHRTNIENYDVLNTCDMIRHIHLDLYGDHDVDLTGFHPEWVQYLTIENYTGDHSELVLDSLSECNKIRELSLSYLNTTDMSFIGKLERIRMLYLRECNNVSDISYLADCKDLQEVTFQDMRSVTDLSCLTDLPNLKNVGAHCEIKNLNFLKGHSETENFGLEFSRFMDDYSGLAAIKNYASLHINLSGRNYSLVENYIKDKDILRLELYQTSVDDLSTLPDNINDLYITRSDITNLENIGHVLAGNLSLISDVHIQSLSGLEKMPNVSALNLTDVPVTDFEAMYDRSWSTLKFDAMETLPDFSRISLNNEFALSVISVAGLTDVDFLNDLSDESASKYAKSISLVGLDEVTDISPLKRFHGDALYISPQMESQAKELVEEGNFNYYTVEYPDYNWQESGYQFTLDSLDELDTLMPSYLERIEYFSIAGEYILKDGMSVQFHKDKSPTVMQYNVEIGEADKGVLQNFDNVSKLTGIKFLQVINQPLSSIDGIQAMNSLTNMEIQMCSNLKDVSPAFTVTSLQSIRISGCAISSLQGIQNLYNLKTISLAGCSQLDDLTPLLLIDGLEVVEVSPNMEAAVNSLEGKDYSFELRYCD